jgi:hypothetical protein
LEGRGQDCIALGGSVTIEAMKQKLKQLLSQRQKQPSVQATIERDIILIPSNIGISFLALFQIPHHFPQLASTDILK